MVRKLTLRRDDCFVSLGDLSDQTCTLNPIRSGEHVSRANWTDGNLCYTIINFDKDALRAEAACKDVN